MKLDRLLTDFMKIIKVQQAL